MEQNHEIFLYKYIDKINQLNNTNIQIDDILKVLYDDILIHFKQRSEIKEKIEHFKEIKKISELENKCNEYQKEINNLEEGLDKGDKNIIENLKQKYIKKTSFIFSTTRSHKVDGILMITKMINVKIII